jgi:hypothetical protein
MSAYFQSLHHFVERHALETPQADELINFHENHSLVVVMDVTDTPEALGNNP